MGGKTLYEKIWDEHLIDTKQENISLLYIDLHLIHEVTSPQAFDGLKNCKRKIHRPTKILATLDHSVPTRELDKPIADKVARLQVDTLRQNCQNNNLELYDIGDKRRGIVHIIAPEQGYTLPGMTIVCGDSHTSTHGAFGTLAFGIGTTEVEHVLATQTLQQHKSKTMKIVFDCELPFGSTAKDMTMGIIKKIGTAGATGYVIEYTGKAIQNLSMEGRMTICNMAIESGARAGLIAPDDVTFKYLQDKPYAPQGKLWKHALQYWKSLYSDHDAVYDKEIILTSEDIMPLVTWGTSPEQVTSINDKVPSPDDFEEEIQKNECKQALDYMGLKEGTAIKDIFIDYVFIGSCANSRIEDLRQVAKIVENKKIFPQVKGIIVPGSGLIKQQAENEKLDKIFIDAGFEWREPGCSMCLGMNNDILQPKQRCASTSNRNFEGRQGKQSRTHLVSPVMAALAAIHGHFVDVRDYI